MIDESDSIGPDDEDLEEESIIPEEDFREAVKACAIIRNREKTL